MEKPSTKKAGMSQIFASPKRLALFGIPLLLFATLIAGGIFATNSHAAAPQMNDRAPKPGDFNGGASKSDNSKNVMVMGTIINIKDNNTLIVRNFQGRGQTMVHIDRNTKFISKGMGRKNSWRDLKVGDFIQATGPRNKDHDKSIQAKLIVVSKPPSDNHSHS
jgi:hypothetical protein